MRELRDRSFSGIRGGHLEILTMMQFLHNCCVKRKLANKVGSAEGQDFDDVLYVDVPEKHKDTFFVCI